MTPPVPPRRLIVAIRVLAIVAGIPILLLAAVLAVLNTDAGRGFVERRVNAALMGAVHIEGLAGRFPDRVRLARLDLVDGTGTWLQATDVALDWSPMALLHRQALIRSLTAGSVSLDRLPVASPAPATQAPARPFSLPVRVMADRIAIARLVLAAPLVPQPVTLSVDGRLDLPSLDAGSAIIAARPLDGAAALYTLKASIDSDRIDAELSLDEPEHGLVAAIAAVPAIGPLTLTATIAGPRSQLAASLDLSAGPLVAHAQGAVDLVARSATIDATAHTPAMQPAPGIGWRGIDLRAHLAGPFAAPAATGRLTATDLEAAGARLPRLVADLSGADGRLTLTAIATALHLPIPDGDLFASAPIRLDASARVDDATLPVRFTLSHPLLGLDGTGHLVPGFAADAVLTAPAIAPLAAMAGIAAAGTARLVLHATSIGDDATLVMDGALALSASPVPDLLGRDATIGLTAQRTGAAVSISRLTLDGAAIHLDAHGAVDAAGMDATARVATPDIGRLVPRLSGAATLELHATGPADAIERNDVALDAAITGTIGGPGVTPAPLRLNATLHGLPGAPFGQITGEGDLVGHTLHLALDAARDATGALHATVTRADWRSLHAEGALTLPPGATIPMGTARLRFTALDDLRPLLGQPIGGSLTAEIASGPDAVTLNIEARNAGVPSARVAHAAVIARITEPLGTPHMTASVTVDGIVAGGIAGKARIEATGPASALMLRAAATVSSGALPVTLNAAAVLDAPAKTLRLQSLAATARNETLRLLAPASVGFADGVRVDRVRLGLRQATLDIAGVLSPTLDASVALRAPANLVALIDPSLDMDGAVTLDAKLVGPTAQPGGTVTLAATGIRLRSGPGRAVPAANLVGTAALKAGSASIDARLTAGAARLTMTGQAPLGAGPISLHADGAMDLAMLNPLLGGQGRRVKGRLTVNAAITGTAASPRLSGQATLAGGEVQDFGQGLRLSGIAASLRADGDTLRIDSFTARAGQGTVGLAGSIGVLVPAMPVDLAITMRNARPLGTDQVTADLDADLTLKGAVTTGLAVAGPIRINRASVRIPDVIPASIAVLPVHRPTDRPAPAAAPMAPIALDLTISAPQQVFVRGRGLDAEMAGDLAIHGDSANPRVDGGLLMRRGTLSLAGTTLTFSRGKIGFDGAGPGDPTLDFAADSTAGGVTATLSIGGYVSKPKITLSSVPDLPQDEVLAYLVFKRSAKDLGPLQIAQIAAGLADLAGVGVGGYNPLEAVRKGLGLDRLSVGSTTPVAGSTAAASPTLEGGRYIAEGVYLGARQGLTGGQTQATVQIDIAKGLKLEADVGAGQATAGQAGNQVGLTYQFEY